MWVRSYLPRKEWFALPTPSEKRSMLRERSIRFREGDEEYNKRALVEGILTLEDDELISLPPWFEFYPRVIEFRKPTKPTAKIEINTSRDFMRYGHALRLRQPKSVAEAMETQYNPLEELRGASYSVGMNSCRGYVLWGVSGDKSYRRYVRLVDIIRAGEIFAIFATPLGEEIFERAGLNRKEMKEEMNEGAYGRSSVVYVPSRSLIDVRRYRVRLDSLPVEAREKRAHADVCEVRVDCSCGMNRFHISHATERHEIYLCPHSIAAYWFAMLNRKENRVLLNIVPFPNKWLIVYYDRLAYQTIQKGNKGYRNLRFMDIESALWWIGGYLNEVHRIAGTEPMYEVFFASEFHPEYVLRIVE